MDSENWLQAIAEEAGVSLAEAEAALNSRGIRPSPVIATPKRLTIRTIAFSGIKTGVADSGPFKFTWSSLDHGIWGLVTEANLKGKTSVLEIVRWMLRGRAPGIGRDVRAWLHACSLRFTLDDILYEVRADVRDEAVRGELLLHQRAKSLTLASFSDEAAFESVMSGFFLRELGLNTIVRWRKGDEEAEKGTPSVHGWASLSGALFIGTDYSVLLGDVPAAAGLSVPLLQMYLGLPWISTLTAAKAAEQENKRVSEAREKRRKANEDARSKRAVVLRSELESKRAKLAETRPDAEVRARLSQAQAAFANHNRLLRLAESNLAVAVAANTQAEDAYRDDKRELQEHLDAAAAGAVFRMLEPSLCPRCDTPCVSVVVASR